MATVVESVKDMPTSNSRICFASNAPLLAAGSVPGLGCIRLRIMRTSPGLVGEQLINESVADFADPPAAFCRLCWSKPLGGGGVSSCPAGLIAGGLENGDVAIWNPHEALRDMPCLHADESTFTESLRRGNWLCRDYEIYQEYCKPGKRRVSPARPPRLEDTTGNLVAADCGAIDLAPVARFSKHAGSVYGLGFNSHWPNLIGSGAENGRVIVWDLANLSAETVPTWQTESIDGDAISCISWSPLLPTVLGSTSFQGLSIWDTRSNKSPMASVGLFPRKSSGLVFSPVNKNSLVVSCEDYRDTPSLAVWDLRSMFKPVSELCENSSGVVAMSWSPHHDDALLVSSKDDKIMLWSLAKQEVIWKRTSLSGRCYDVQWSPSTRGVFAAASHNNLELFKWHDRA